MKCALLRKIMYQLNWNSLKTITKSNVNKKEEMLKSLVFFVLFVFNFVIIFMFKPNQTLLRVNVSLLLIDEQSLPFMFSFLAVLLLVQHSYRLINKLISFASGN